MHFKSSYPNTGRATYGIYLIAHTFLVLMTRLCLNACMIKVNQLCHPKEFKYVTCLNSSQVNIQHSNLKEGHKWEGHSHVEEVDAKTLSWMIRHMP